MSIIYANLLHLFSALADIIKNSILYNVRVWLPLVDTIQRNEMYRSHEGENFGNPLGLGLGLNPNSLTIRFEYPPFDVGFN